jgi:hypothetical protein
MLASASSGRDSVGSMAGFRQDGGENQREERRRRSAVEQLGRCVGFSADAYMGLYHWIASRMNLVPAGPNSEEQPGPRRLDQKRSRLVRLNN